MNTRPDEPQAPNSLSVQQPPVADNPLSFTPGPAIRELVSFPQAGNPHHIPADLEQAEMTGNDGDFEMSALTFRQKTALPAIALAPTLTQAARDSGVSESTLRRWLHNPAFRQQLDNYHQESARLARLQAQALLPRCISVLADAMDSSDITLRLRAARYAMSFALQLSEVQALKSSLEKLEEAIHATNSPRIPS